MWTEFPCRHTLSVAMPGLPFRDRAVDFAQHRPGYPPAVVSVVERQLGARAPAVVADIGCGTGHFARPFLERGFRVWGVEPDASMAELARAAFRRCPSFVVTPGRAEKTGLPDGCAQIVSAAQAFHWFDRAAAKIELERICAPEGAILIAWNERDARSELSLAYDAILAAVCPGASVRPRPTVREHDLRAFLAPRKMMRAVVDNPQWCDFEGFIGRFRSAASAPPRSSPAWPTIEAAFRRLFDAFQQGGRVCLPMKTQLRWG